MKMEEWNKQLEEYSRELAILKPPSDSKNIYWVEQKPLEILGPQTMSREEFFKEFNMVKKLDE